MAVSTATSPPARPRLAWAGALAAGVLFLGFYAVRIDPWVGAADTAKFQFIGATLGTSHAPGYPGYVLLLHLLSRLLPFVAWAAAADLFSALCMAATVVLVALAAAELGARQLPALAAAVAFGSLPIVRSLGSGAEVYPLHVLLIAGAALALLRWRRGGRLAQLMIGGALLSLGLSHHTTIVCSYPAAALVAASRRLPLRRLLAWAPLFALLALAPFSYIVWRSYSPVSSHVEMQAHSAAQLWDGLSGAQHRGNLLAIGLGDIVRERLPWIGGQLWHQEGWLLALALLGLLMGGDRRGRAFVALLALGTMAFTLVYTIPDLEVYLLPVHLAVALGIALGAQRVSELLPPALKLPLCLAVALTPAVFGQRPPANDAPWAHEMAAIVDAMPPDAVLVSFDYSTSMALLYQAWERHGGVPRLQAIPGLGLVIPIATDRLRRHLSGGVPFRLGPRDELVAPGTPLICHCPDATARELLARQGLLGEPTLRSGLWRLRALPQPPTLPAAVLVSRQVTVTSLREVITAVASPSFDPAETAVRLGRRAGEAIRRPGGSVALREVSADALVADVTSPAGGWLVLTDLYESRWTVTVDGRPADSFRADILFMALEVPSGDHRVEVRRDRRPFSLDRWLRGPWGYLGL